MMPFCHSNDSMQPGAMQCFMLQLSNQRLALCYPAIMSLAQSPAQHGKLSMCRTVLSNFVHVIAAAAVGMSSL